MAEETTHIQSVIGHILTGGRGVFGGSLIIYEYNFSGY